MNRASHDVPTIDGVPLWLHLAVAVPRRIRELACLAEEERAVLTKDLAGQSKHGDQLLYGGPHQAEEYALFVETLALLSFAPGGTRPLRITGGQAWEAQAVLGLWGSKGADA